MSRGAGAHKCTTLDLCWVECMPAISAICAAQYAPRGRCGPGRPNAVLRRRRALRGAAATAMVVCPAAMHPPHSPCPCILRVCSLTLCLTCRAPTQTCGPNPCCTYPTNPLQISLLRSRRRVGQPCVLRQAGCALPALAQLGCAPNDRAHCAMPACGAPPVHARSVLHRDGSARCAQLCMRRGCPPAPQCLAASSAWPESSLSAPLHLQIDTYRSIAPTSTPLVSPRPAVASGDPAARQLAEGSLRQMSAGDIFAPGHDDAH